MMTEDDNPLEFKVGDFVFLNVVPLKGVIHFGKKDKQSPRFIGPLGFWKG